MTQQEQEYLQDAVDGYVEQIRITAELKRRLVQAYAALDSGRSELVARIQRLEFEKQAHERRALERNASEVRYLEMKNNELRTTISRLQKRISGLCQRITELKSPPKPKIVYRSRLSLLPSDALASHPAESLGIMTETHEQAEYVQALLNSEVA